MIRYALRCDRDHEFEAWFRSIGDYDRSAAAGAVICAVCGSTSVEKALMAPAVSGVRSQNTVSLAAPDPKRAEFIKAMKELRAKVTEGADYVGGRFAEEARKIHYEEVEARGIYGEATSDEAKALAEEGIGFMPLPQVPEDRN